MKMKKNVIAVLLSLMIAPLFAEESDLLINIEKKTLIFEEKININDKEMVFHFYKYEMEHLQKLYNGISNPRLDLMSREQYAKIEKFRIPVNVFTVELNDKILLRLGEYYKIIFNPYSTVSGALLYNRHNDTLYCLITLSPISINPREDAGDTRFHLYEIKNFDSEINTYKVGDKLKPDMAMVYGARPSKYLSYPRVDDAISPFSIYLLGETPQKTIMTCDEDNIYVDLHFRHDDPPVMKYIYNIKTDKWSGDRRKPDFDRILKKRSSPQ